MNKKTLWIVIVVVILLIIAWAVNRMPSSSSQSPSSVRPMRVGAILPLTGPIAAAGQFTKEGIEKALADMAKGGKTPNVEVFFEDGAYDSKTTLPAYTKLKSTHDIDALIVFGTPSVMPLAPIVNTDHIPMIGLLATPAYSTPGDYTFRNVASADDTAKYAADVLTDKLGKKKIAVMYLNNDYGIGALKSFKGFVGSRATVVAEEGGATAATDYRTQITKIKTANPDAVYMAMLYKEGGLFIKQAKSMGLTNVTFLCDQPCSGGDLISTAGEASEGMIVVTPVTDSQATFSIEYKQTYGAEPNYLAYRMYDSVNVLSSVAKKCETQSYAGECLKDELAAVKDFPGVLYPINFNENGDLQDQLSTKIIQGGKFVPFN